MTKEAYQLWNDVASETFVEDLTAYLTQRLKDEREIAEAKKAESQKQFEGTPVVVVADPKPVKIWFQFATTVDRAIILAVGKDFARVKSELTAAEKKICFNHVVEYRDVSDKEE